MRSGEDFFFFLFKVKELRECLYSVGSNLVEREG